MLGRVSGWMVLTLGLLVIVPAACAALLRWARCPGWPVLGGLAAGLILGPTIFGRVMPDHYRDLLEGGRQEALVVQALVASPAAKERPEAVERAKRLEQDARWAHQRPLRAFTFVAVALMLLGSSAFSVPRAGGAQTAGAMSIGAWSAALPGGLAFFCCGGRGTLAPMRRRSRRPPWPSARGR
jgi:hypothetical protein